MAASESKLKSASYKCLKKSLLYSPLPSMGTAQIENGAENRIIRAKAPPPRRSENGAPFYFAKGGKQMNNNSIIQTSENRTQSILNLIRLILFSLIHLSIYHPPPNSRWIDRNDHQRKIEKQKVTLSRYGNSGAERRCPRQHGILTAKFRWLGASP